MLVERLFGEKNHGIDYGNQCAAELFGGRQELGIRLRFQSDPPAANDFYGANPSIGDPLPRTEVFRNWVGAWGAKTDEQCFMLGTAGSGTVIFLVADGKNRTATVVSNDVVFRHHCAGRPYRELVAAWSHTGHMALWLDGISMGKATDQTAVKKLGVPSSSLILGHQPSGPFFASPGLRIFEVDFYSHFEPTTRVDPALKGGLEIRGVPPLLGSMTFDGSSASGREELRGPRGVIAYGHANFSKPYVPLRPPIV
jgi:hypothetical protein